MLQQLLQQNSRLKLHLALVRIYIGIDFIHHFAEKFGLLGVDAYTHVSQYFANAGMPHYLLLIAGLCEFASFVGFTFGLMTRIAGGGAALYIIIALFAGNHQNLGFTWANPGGGWEFPLFWAVICASYVLTGGGQWSLDNILFKKAPRSLRFLFM